MANRYPIDEQLRYANVPRTIRFTEELFEELRAVCEEHHFSFNQLVLWCCEYSLRHRDPGES